MRAKLATLGMSMVVAFALAAEGLATAYYDSSTTATSKTDTTVGESMTQNANTGARRTRRGGRRRANTNTGAATETTPEATTPPAEQTPPAATATMTPRPRQRRGGRRGGSRTRMMRGVPSGVEACLNHLAQMAANDPLIDYEGHPSEIINNGLLWNDEKSKCAMTDQAQRAKVFELANAWRMKDAAKVRSLLSELGATGTTGSR